MNGLVTNYEDLGSISKFLKTKFDELNTLYGDLETLYNEIGKNWNGKDYDTYIVKARNILNKNRDASKNVEVLGDILDYASNKYSTSEENFKKVASGGAIYGE